VTQAGNTTNEGKIPMTTKSNKQGWTKTGRSQYTHENGHRVVKCSQGWEVFGPNANDGYVYQTMWAAMYAAAKTPAAFANVN